MSFTKKLEHIVVRECFVTFCRKSVFARLQFKNKPVITLRIIPSLGVWYVSGKEKVLVRFWFGVLKEKDHLWDLGTDAQMILKYILKTWGGRTRTGLIWLRIGTCCSCFEYVYETSGSIKLEDFMTCCGTYLFKGFLNEVFSVLSTNQTVHPALHLRHPWPYLTKN